MKSLIRILPIIIFLAACSHQTEQSFDESTLHAQAPAFKSINQDGKFVTQENVKGKIYIVDFFFTSCPTICPAMREQLQRVYQKYENNADVIILSHTIDPEYDTLELLKTYALKAGSDGKKWMFLRDDRKATLELANKGYFAATKPQFYGTNQDHSHTGGLYLVDYSGQIRGVYYGTIKEQVDKMMDDIDFLLEQKK